MKKLALMATSTIFLLVMNCASNGDSGTTAARGNGTPTPGTLTISASLTPAIYANNAYNVHLYDKNGTYVAGLWSKNTVGADGTVKLALKVAKIDGCIVDKAADAVLDPGDYVIYFLVDTNGSNAISQDPACSNLGGKISDAEMGFRKVATINGNTTINIVNNDLLGLVTETFSVSGGASGASLICFIYDQLTPTNNYPGVQGAVLGPILGIGLLTGGAGTVNDISTFVKGEKYNLACLSDSNNDFVAGPGDAVGLFNGITINGTGISLNTWVAQ